MVKTFNTLYFKNLVMIIHLRMIPHSSFHSISAGLIYKTVSGLAIKAISVVVVAALVLAFAFLMVTLNPQSMISLLTTVFYLSH